MTNAIHYIDFEPQVVDKKFWKGNVYEPMHDVMERMNEWVRRHYNYDIINVETVLIPKPVYGTAHNSQHKLNMHGGNVFMVELVRVWYKE